MKSRLVSLALEPLEDRTLLSTCIVRRSDDVGSRDDLRYCITKANKEPGADIIRFRSSAYGTINLTGALPNIASSLTIEGPGADLLTVRRDTGGSYRIFTITGGDVSISGLTITNGLSNGTTPILNWGGGIYSSGNLVLESVAVVGNLATQGPGFTPAVRGGGVYSAGSLVVADSLIADNHASVTSIGAGVLGGGIALDDGSSAVIVNSTISGNRVQGNTPSFGIFVGGGGVSGSTTIRNSTISGNLVTNPMTGPASGGGLRGSQISVTNSIIAGNSAKSAVDVSGNINSQGHNLIGNSTGGSGYAPTDQLNTNPTLAALADNGGPTLTHSLLPGSPAIDTGDNTNAPEFDQRGPGFPRIVNDTIDIGAFEVQATRVPSQPRFLAFLITAEIDQNEQELFQ